MRNLTRRSLLLAAGAAAGWSGSNLFHADLPVLDGTARLIPPEGAHILNDASGLSPTPIHRHITLTQSPDDSLIVMGALIVTGWDDRLQDWQPIFWLEVLASFAFATSWAVKGEAMQPLVAMAVRAGST